MATRVYATEDGTRPTKRKTTTTTTTTTTGRDDEDANDGKAKKKKKKKRANAAFLAQMARGRKEMETEAARTRDDDAARDASGRGGK
jgi:hypothetical protein